MTVFRNAQGSDVGPIREMLCAAFSGAGEADLVEALRDRQEMAHEWVLDDGTGPIAYAGLSEMVGPQGWLCLAPVAVWPAQQGQGHGLRLMQKIANWNAARPETVVVLGQVAFYEKAGFSQARAQSLVSPYPLSHTMLLGGEVERPEVVLTYPSAFDDLD